MTARNPTEWAVPSHLDIEAAILARLAAGGGRPTVLVDMVSQMAVERGGLCHRKVIYSVVNRLIKQSSVVKSRDGKTVRISAYLS